MINKKIKLKRYFFTNISTFELKQKLQLTNKEYSRLNEEILEEYDLPMNYNRTPSKYGKYIKESFILIDEDNVMGYYPSKKYIQDLIKNKESSKIRIIRATDDNLAQLIKEDYPYMNYEEIQCKYKLPYYKTYELINKIKQDNNLININTKREKRYIYYNKKIDCYYIRKQINNKIMSFGSYKNLGDAVKVRDYLEENEWNKEKLKSFKEMNNI